MKPLSEALDALGGQPGTARAEGTAGSIEVDVADVDRLGVRVSRVKVARSPVDVEAEAHALPQRLRALPHAIAPVEVAPTLGGARLRSIPAHAKDGWFEVAIEPGESVVTRTVRRGAERVSGDWTMTREQLEQLVEELGG